MEGQWKKSSHSAGNSGNCVEARVYGPRFQVRDSVLGDDSPILNLTNTDFNGFLASVKR